MTVTGANRRSDRPAGARRRPPDVVLLAAVLALVLIGLVVSYTASFPVGLQWFHDANHFVKRQLAWMAIGLLAMYLMYSIAVATWQRYAALVMGATLCMLSAILPFGTERFGGQRWIVGGGSVQPSEAAKLAVIIFVAAWLAGKQDEIGDIMLGLLPFAILVGVICGLILLQPDFSTAALVALIATAMFFAAGAELTQILFAGAAGAGALALLVLRAPYRLERVHTFFHPEDDPTNAGFQVRQTLASIMRGGLTGVGLGEGQQKHLLPAPHTDAVFAVLGEEIGILGCVVVLGLFAVIAWRGLRIAAGSANPFGAYVAVGVTCWICFQALLNVAGVTALVPLSGVPLPFISFGGSSLVMCLAAIGLLLNISRTIEPKRATIHADLDLRRGNRRTRLSRSYRDRRLDG